MKFNGGQVFSRSILFYTLVFVVVCIAAFVGYYYYMSGPESVSSEETKALTPEQLHAAEASLTAPATPTTVEVSTTTAVSDKKLRSSLSASTANATASAAKEPSISIINSLSAPSH